MAEVIANTKGYFGGTIREAGEPFSVPDDIWDDKKKRPKWVRVDPASVFGGKGDHDGDGSVGGSKPSIPAGSVEIPEAWEELAAADRKALAKALSGQAVANAKGADAIISAEVEKRTPAPKLAGNGVQEALGGPAPDWLLPGAQAPQPVTD
ncbi:hypothetical protein EOS93_25200 [Rhizobium sp. RMa-01]|uniref:hypothetical protein n=1 Tax=unclassified Rhizobium TaxID=2613769 RepID=UPI0008DB1B3A|nr:MULTISPECIES: hypothetical protein [unclassified Rhizobium]OHV24943.1 hypothetical protein BBJ66_22635 [Rhizobium sp. RSm-3]RVU08352.1 hypothetical protein EOS93_25200 [Rhizobium sp. RMa-01]